MNNNEILQKVCFQVEAIKNYLEKIQNEQKKLSSIINADPELMSQKNEEINNIINDYLKRIEEAKKIILQEINDVTSEITKETENNKESLNNEINEIQDLLKSAKQLSSSLNTKKRNLEGILNELTNAIDNKADAILSEKKEMFLVEYNKELASTANKTIQDLKTIADQLEEKIKKMLTEYQNIERDISRLKSQIVSEVIEEASKKIVEINPCREYVININGWENRFKSGELFHEKFKKVLALAAMKKPIILKGPAGSGKNVIVEQVAKALNLQFYYINDVTDEYKILGFIDANGNFQKTQFFEAFTKGGVMFIDEIDNSNPSALLAINSAIGTGDSHYMTFPDGNLYKADPNFRVIAAANTFGTGADSVYCGRQTLDGASLNRFSPIIIDYDKEIERKLTNNADILELFWSIREIISKNEIRHVISTRNIINAVELLNSKYFSLEDVFDLTLIQSLDNFSLITIAKELNPNIKYARQLLAHLNQNYNVTTNAYGNNNNDYDARNNYRNYNNIDDLDEEEGFGRSRGRYPFPY